MASSPPLIVFVFLRNWRSTLIAAIAIPTSIIATYTLMNAMGFTLDQITMLALVLMVGIVIDDAIVVLENVFRFMEEKNTAARWKRPARHARHRSCRSGDNAQPRHHLPASRDDERHRRASSCRASATRRRSPSWFRCSSASR